MPATIRKKHLPKKQLHKQMTVDLTHDCTWILNGVRQTSAFSTAKTFAECKSPKSLSVYNVLLTRLYPEQQELDGQGLCHYRVLHQSKVCARIS